MSLTGSLIGQDGYVYPACLHVELHHYFLYIADEALHALLCLSLGEGELRLCYFDFASPATPVEDWER